MTLQYTPPPRPTPEALAEAAAAVSAMQAQASTLMANIDSALVAIRALERRVKAIVDEQAADPRLWHPARREWPGDVNDEFEYLQRALRRLHGAVEGEDSRWLERPRSGNPGK